MQQFDNITIGSWVLNIFTGPHIESVFVRIFQQLQIRIAVEQPELQNNIGLQCLSLNILFIENKQKIAGCNQNQVQLLSKRTSELARCSNSNQNCRAHIFEITLVACQQLYGWTLFKYKQIIGPNNILMRKILSHAEEISKSNTIYLSGRCSDLKLLPGPVQVVGRCAQRGSHELPEGGLGGRGGAGMSAQKDSKTLQNNRWLIEWNPIQDDMLFMKYVQLGSRWSQLASFIPSKTDNSIKNRFYCCMRKVQRKLNKVQKDRKIKHRKLIKYESLLTFLEIGKSNFDSSDRRLANAFKNYQQIIEVRDAIIKLAKTPQNDIKDQQAQHLLLRFLGVKFSLKFINLDRVKRSQDKSLAESERQSTYGEIISGQPKSKQIYEAPFEELCLGAHSSIEEEQHDPFDLELVRSDFGGLRVRLSVLQECEEILGEKQNQCFPYDLMFL